MTGNTLTPDDLASQVRALESQKRALIASVHDLQAIVRLLSCNRLLVVDGPRRRKGLTMLTTERDREINQGWRNLAGLEHELGTRLRAKPPFDWRLLRPLWRQLAIAWGQKCLAALQAGAEPDEVGRCARYTMSYILDAEGARNLAEE